MGFFFFNEVSFLNITDNLLDFLKIFHLKVLSQKLVFIENQEFVAWHFIKSWMKSENNIIRYSAHKFTIKVPTYFFMKI